MQKRGKEMCRAKTKEIRTKCTQFEKWKRKTVTSDLSPFQSICFFFAFFPFSRIKFTNRTNGKDNHISYQFVNFVVFLLQPSSAEFGGPTFGCLSFDVWILNSGNAHDSLAQRNYRTNDEIDSTAKEYVYDDKISEPNRRYTHTILICINLE